MDVSGCGCTNGSTPWYQCRQIISPSNEWPDPKNTSTYSVLMCITIQDLHINLVCNFHHNTNRFDPKNSYYQQNRKHNNIHRIFHTYPLCITALTFQDSSKWWSQTNATNPWWRRRLNSGQFQINHLSSSSSTRSWTINGHVKRSDQRVLICSCCSELRPATPRSHFWFESISPLGCVSSVGPICSCSSDW